MSQFFLHSIISFSCQSIAIGPFSFFTAILAQVNNGTSVFPKLFNSISFASIDLQYHEVSAEMFSVLFHFGNLKIFSMNMNFFYLLARESNSLAIWICAQHGQQNPAIASPQVLPSMLFWSLMSPLMIMGGTKGTR